MKIDFNFSKTVKGFMDDHEAEELYLTARKAAELGPCLEIGSYCGKSAYFIGMACKEKKSILFSIDHHKGSEEQQPGEEYFDPDLFDKEQNCIDTFKFFKDTIKRASLLDTVVPVVADSATAGKMWSTPVAFVFIDGGHTFEAAYNDYSMWSKHIMPGGFLVIHDIFMDPDKGGQAPRKIYEKALGSGEYEKVAMTGTLGVLRKLADGR
ncbi:MAG: class I SAM-dependent methyltransferase [Thermodesulfobacteriota bacterium]|nr:class I SAM-dependent methyltransferase [Thermodesulfobacteriota bacterium]